MIRLSKSTIGNREKEAVLGVLDREYLGIGAEVQQFEDALTRFFGRPTVCVNTGTAALHLALQACGIETGSEVLVPSLTYVASFQAISATGARPVACDIDPISLTLDLHDAEQRLSPRTKAIMPVHYSGGVGDLDGLYAFANRNGLRVIEDAAHAFGTVYRGRRVGSFGDVSCFSFDGIKNITSGEGGCVVTSDENVLRQVRDARLLGVEKDTERRYAGNRSWEFQVRMQGWRYHMSNVMAAIGLAQLERFTELSEKRRKLARLYDTRLRQTAGITVMPHKYDDVVPHLYVIRIAGLRDRDRLRAVLLDQGIQTGVHYQPNHWLEYFAAKGAFLPLPAVEAVYPELLSLPLHPDLSDKDVEFVCDKLLLHLHEQMRVDTSK
jgi:dTDP-4-amino-4,6-dideoxygalactose transaminase